MEERETPKVDFTWITHRHPRFMQLCDYLEREMKKLDSTKDDPDLAAFCEAQHIVGLSTTGVICDRIEDGKVLKSEMSLIVRMDKSIKELKPLRDDVRFWLEKHYGAALVFVEKIESELTGRVLRYQMCRPPLDSMELFYPGWPLYNLEWNGRTLEFRDSNRSSWAATI